mgnify:CR=1 FL=1
MDPFGGQADLQSGIVRAVGVPRQRFTEDALRILRLYRFAARFGFAIDPPTAQAAQELCAHLDCVSVERIEEELAKLLSAPAPAAYLDEKILFVILPELTSEALAAAKPVVDACPAGAETCHPAGGAAAEPWRGRHPPHTQAPALLQCLY